MMMIKYTPRYSETLLPDKFGRWAKVVSYKEITIGWISRLEVKDRVVFKTSCYFPTKSNDIANEYKTFTTLEEAKEFIEERWEWFLKIVS